MVCLMTALPMPIFLLAEFPVGQLATPVSSLVKLPPYFCFSNFIG